MLNTAASALNNFGIVVAVACWTCLILNTAASVLYNFGIVIAIVA